MPLFVQALKQYNKNQVKWTIPKRGTDDYNQVMKIMNDMKSKSKKSNKTTTRAAN